MKKKSVILTLTAGCAAISAFALALTSQSGFATLFAKTRAPRTHLIQFDYDKCYEDTYDGTYFRNFVVYEFDAFEDTSGNLYDFETYSDNTFVGGDSNDNSVTFGGDHFVSIHSNNYEIVRISFRLIKSAELTSNSKFTYYLDDTYKGVSYFELFDDTDEKYNIYSAYLSVINDIGYFLEYETITPEEGEEYEEEVPHYVNINLLQLEFTCA